MTTGLSAFSFGSPFWLWGLLLLPIMGGLFLWAERRARRRLERLIQTPRLRGQLTGAASTGRRRLRYALLLAGWAGLLVAMAEPRKGDEVHETHRRGLDLIVIVDVSKSMLATDVAPDRLRRAKLSIQDLIGELGGDRLGLVAFAGSAFLEAPLTIDYDAVLDANAELDTDLIPLGGTNIGAAINLALAAFGKSETGNRAILLFSDGEPTSDTEQANGVQAAERAAGAGVKVFTIGIGTPEGSLIPLNGNGTEFVRDQDGKIVRSRLDESNLRDIAKAGNGMYQRLTNGGATLHTVVTQGLNQMKSSEIDAKTERRPIERYQWPLGAGMMFLALAALVGERRKTVVSSEAAKTSSRLAGARLRSPATVAVLVFTLGGMVTPFPSIGKAADAAATPNAAPTGANGNALDLYRNGRYDEAYRAFEELAKKNPEVSGLQFNAGASAYMGKQYDEALDAFGNALTSDNADLQAKAHYNFGNTLFRRGEEQKDKEAKLKDWKNAIQHYNRTLETLKASGQDNSLASNTAYNRDLVQKRLDEEMKQPPSSPKEPQQNQDQKEQKPQDQQKQSPDQPQQGQGGQQKQDQQQQGQKNKDQPQSGQEQQNGHSAPQNQPPPAQGSSNPEDQNADANQPPDAGKQPTSGNRPPDPSSPSKQDASRQRGDFQSQADGTPKPTDQPPEPADEAGKMSPRQARALLNSLKGEDDHVMLNGNPENPKKHDEPVIKDW